MSIKGHNVGELKKKIADAISSVRELKEERSSINGDIAAVRERMNALGIKKAAFDMAMKYLDWDEDKRQNFDLAYALVREAGGVPMQEDLFQAAERMAAEQDAKPERPGADPNEIEKVIASQDAEKVKGKKVHASSAGTGAIN